MPFIDRRDAGRRLGRALHDLRGESCVVLGLPRGGVPVAREVALELDAPLDVIIVRKLGVPFQPELAMGAIGEANVTIVNNEIVRLAQVSPRELAAVQHAERAELDRRVLRFRGGHPRMSLRGRTAIIVDDGVATGSTARAACQVVRDLGARRVVLAVPVAPAEIGARLRQDVDEYVCLEEPEPFVSVGRHYDDFSATSDQEVLECLAPMPASPAPHYRDDRTGSRQSPDG